MAADSRLSAAEAASGGAQQNSKLLIRREELPPARKKRLQARARMFLKKPVDQKRFPHGDEMQRPLEALSETEQGIHLQIQHCPTSRRIGEAILRSWVPARIGLTFADSEPRALALRAPRSLLRWFMTQLQSSAQRNYPRIISSQNSRAGVSRTSEKGHKFLSTALSRQAHEGHARSCTRYCEVIPHCRQNASQLPRVNGRCEL
jgi:hypothetical protein